MKIKDVSAIIVTQNKATGSQVKSILKKILIEPPQILDSIPDTLSIVNNNCPDLTLIDISTDQEQALKFIEHSRLIQPHMVFIALIPPDDHSIYLQALRHGVHATLACPLHEEEAQLVISNTSNNNIQIPFNNSKLELRDSDGFCGMVGTSPAMTELFSLILRLGQEGESTVLIQGESGVGKELVAKALHKCSLRANKPFVPINCAAIPDSLLESELFGHEKGAFTGATKNKKGRMQHAHGGTVFLDEISEMQPALQAKLLRVLQEKEFEPIGKVQSVKFDARIIAATNVDLTEAVQNKAFRSDLFYRLSVVPLHVPALRTRPSDIPLLLEKFSLFFNRGRKSEPKRFSSEAVQFLKNYSWPGNVRELKNLVQRLCVLHQGPVIKLNDLPQELHFEQLQKPVATEEYELSSASREFLEAVSESDQEKDFNAQLSDFEDRLILQALLATNGNKKQAAKYLNLKRTTLLEKIKKKGLDYVFCSLHQQGI